MCVLQVIELEIREQERRVYSEQLKEDKDRMASEYERKLEQVRACLDDKV